MLYGTLYVNNDNDIDITSPIMIVDRRPPVRAVTMPSMARKFPESRSTVWRPCCSGTSFVARLFPRLARIRAWESTGSGPPRSGPR